jgi:ribosomal protein S18 acetylase RimI-like enzyme
VVEISVHPMTPDEFDRWWSALARSYAASQVRTGNWPTDGAVDRALASNATLLPRGLDTPGHLLLTGRRADGTPVGVLWIGLTHPRGAPDCAFVYDIEVIETLRGSGYGRGLLAAGEAAVRAHGIGHLELNVFGDNVRAIRLYDSAGYRVTQQQMRKRLTAQPEGAD